MVDGLDGPRGLDALGHGKTLITESDGTFSLVIERRGKDAKQIELGPVPPGFGHAIAAGKHGKIYILTGAGGEPGGEPVPGRRRSSSGGPATTSRSRCSTSAEYQANDPDPYDLEGLPEDSNPFGLAALRDGSLLIADAAGNDLIRWWPNGDAVTVARLKPRW